MHVPEKPRDFFELLEKSRNTNEFLNNPEISKIVKEYNEEYLHWDELKYKQLKGGLTRDRLWVGMKTIRVLSYKFLKFDKWDFKYCLIDEFQKKIHVLDMDAAGQMISDFGQLFLLVLWLVQEMR